MLRRCDDEAKQPVLIRALDDPSPLVRASAAEALGDQLDAASLRPLIRATEDDYRIVRVRAASSLAGVPPRLLGREGLASVNRAIGEFAAACISGVLTLEEGVRRLTSDPADFFGIKDRGRLQTGLAADITIFDQKTIGSPSHGERRFDLPGGGKRMVMPSYGVRYTFVNGVATYAEGELVGAGAGKVLRS